MSFAALTRLLPKPLLFGIYGAVGGLVGALLLGEVVWRLLEPPPPVPPKPVMAVTASPAVQVYQQRSNTFTIQAKIAQPLGAAPQTPAPVKVRFDDLPAGIQIAPVTLTPRGADGYEGEVTVTATREAQTREVKLTAVAVSAVGPDKLTASVPFVVKVDPLPKPMVDIAFVLDTSGSMQYAINGVVGGINNFARALDKGGFDLRLGLVAFCHPDTPPTVNVLDFGDRQFTADVGEFQRKASELREYGGGPDEASLEGVMAAAKLPWRAKATRVIILITDEPPFTAASRVVRSQPTYRSVQEVVKPLSESKLDQLHLVIYPQHTKMFTPLQEAAPGKVFNLQRIATRQDTFENLMPELSQVIADSTASAKPLDQPKADAAPPPTTTQSLVSSRRYAEGSELRLLAAIAIWTALIAAAICAALLAGQTHYVKSRLPGPLPLLAAVGGGLAAGVVGGLVGQGLYSFAPQNKILEVGLQLLGWVILGGLAGVGLSFFVPNFKPLLAAAGGLTGGLIGVFAFLVASMASDMVGRIAGSTILGFCIGAMLTLVEVAFRRAWLEVRFGERETISVNLGPEPVKVGGDSRACTVWVRGARDVALRYFVRDGKVVCHDLATGGEQVAAAGAARTLGNVTLTVRTGHAADPPAAPAPAPARPSYSPPPAAVPGKRPPLVVTAADDPLPLPPPVPVARPPVPVASTVAPPVAKPPAPVVTAARPPVAKPPAPVVTAAVPPPPPVAAPAARCGECGSTNVTGKSPARICNDCGAMG